MNSPITSLRCLPITSLRCLLSTVIVILSVPSVSVKAEDLHPRGLFEKPQEGLNTPLARTAADAEDWKDKLHFSLRSSVRYDDNIFLSSMNEESDVIFSVSPTLRFSSAEEGTAANTLSISYTPSFRIYAANTDRNTVDHSLSIRLGKSMPKTQIGFSLSYDKTSGSSRDVSGTVERESLKSSVSVSYILTGKTHLDLGVDYDKDIYGSGSLSGNESYGVNAALMYQATGKITAGPYVSYDIDNLSSGSSSGSSDQNSLGYGLRFTYAVSGKTAVNGSLGSSMRSFSGSGASGDSTSVVWKIGASHAISSKTSLRASIYSQDQAGNRDVNSAFLSTGIAISATHQASTRLSYYATFTYKKDDYFEANAAGVSLDNDYYSLTLGSRYSLDNGLSLGADVTYREESSGSAAGNEFDNLSFGISASYNFW